MTSICCSCDCNKKRKVITALSKGMLTKDHVPGDLEAGTLNLLAYLIFCYLCLSHAVVVVHIRGSSLMLSNVVFLPWLILIYDEDKPLIFKNQLSTSCRTQTHVLQTLLMMGSGPVLHKQHSECDLKTK